MGFNIPTARRLLWKFRVLRFGVLSCFYPPALFLFFCFVPFQFTGEGGPILVGLPVWPQIYLCLRCGGREDAANVALAALASPQNASFNARGKAEVKVLEQR